MGAGAEGQAGEEAGWYDLPAVYQPTGGAGLHRGVPRAGGGRLWSAYLPQAVLHGRPLRRTAHRVAGAHPQQERRGRAAKVAQRGGDHRLEPALPVGIRIQGGDHGKIWLEGGAAAGEEHHAARCGNAVCPPVASALVRANLPEWCGVRITTMAQLLDCVAV